MNTIWASMSEDDKIKAKEQLKESKLTVKCRAPAAAFILLGKREELEKALSLSLVSKDSEETDKISIPIVDLIE